jgi:CDP-diacylglycerol--glycerol-3-phosphate 3-phosphatidyltransferase
MIKLFKLKDFLLIPNLITILRFFLIAPLIITFQNGMQNYFLIILVVSLLTDFLDGIAARALNQKSELGKTLDPIADGITLFAFIILFNREGFISNWFTIFYFLRQLTILLFSLWYLRKLKTVYGSNIFGKTGVCFLGVVLCIFALRLDNFFFITSFMLNISSILLFVSLLDYLRFFLNIEKNNRTN